MTINILNMGAIPNNKDDCSIIIQKAIDDCSLNGGGTVEIPKGSFYSKPFRMKSNVELKLQSGCTLYASDKVEDYAEWQDIKDADGKFPRLRNACFIFADNCFNISITGKGVIDCNGQAFVEENKVWNGWKYKRKDVPTPPRVIMFTGCSNVIFNDFTLKNTPAGWAIFINHCQNISFLSCKILTNVQYPNNDGIHINCCDHVNVNKCILICGDDCIVVRSNNSMFLDRTYECKNIIVSDCDFISYSAGIRIGWINDGVIKDCIFRNIRMKDTSVGIAIVFPDKERVERASDEGGEHSEAYNLLFENIEMDGIYGRPILMRVGNTVATLCRKIEDITFRKIIARGITFPYIKGRIDCRMNNICFDNCKFEKSKYIKLSDSLHHGAAAWDIMQNDADFLIVNAECDFNNTKFID